MVKLSAFCFHARQLWPRELQSLLRIPNYGRFYLAGMLANEISVTQLKRPGAPSLKNLIGVAEVRLTLSDQTAYVGKVMTLGFKHSRYTMINRDAAKITAPS